MYMKISRNIPIFLISAVLVFGTTISMGIPTTFAQSYEDSGKDKKSTSVNKQKVNCNNIIINGVNSAGQGSGDMINAMTADEEDGTGQWLEKGDKKESNGIDNNIVNFCKNKNNQVVEGTATLSIMKTISCTPEINSISPTQQACDALTTGAGLPEGQIFPEDFTISVTGNNPNPSSFPGSSTPVDVKLGDGSYGVEESPDQEAIDAAKQAIEIEFTTVEVTGPFPTWSGDCNVLDNDFTASGSIEEGESQTCNINNEFRVVLD
jgi:hypothetical protein